MASKPASTGELSPLKQALLALDRMQARIAQLEGERHEPIAVLGMGCRFPGGAVSPDAFWRNLLEGIDSVGEVPPQRPGADAWLDADAEQGTLRLIRQGGFLEHVDLFDPGFFGISPREAERMDPQQRLLLMVAVEALEAGGLPLESVAGTAAGVFIGIHSQSSDYFLLQAMQAGEMDTYTGTGTAHSIAANRISYALDLRGPSVAVDTACSSSLVALHLACQSLRQRECDVALAGGVNLMLSPETSLAFSRLDFLSPDGRCKTFDKDANGFVRAEGCGVLALKRLADAQRDGDPVLAVIRGTAVNQDGATNGLTAPSGRSQEAVVRAALENARITAAQVSLLETHGTGTPLGDPIEVEALRNVLGPTTRCALGAVKTHIGHAEAAAGIAGVIKTVLALQHRVIPPNLHYRALNPHITLDGSGMYIPTAPVSWEAASGGRFAGVSSFGFGGTNGHVILQEAPPSEPGASAAAATRPFLLPVSARSDAALNEYASSWRNFLEGVADAELPDIVSAAALRKSHHSRRLAIVGNDAAELSAVLDGVTTGEMPPGVARGHADNRAPMVAFVFSGQGTQWWGMGRELMATEPVFAAEIARCAEAMKAHVEWNLREELARGAQESRLDSTEIAQPALFALQVGLSALWRSWGVAPDALVGHSVGEVAAAHVGGLLSFDDAIKVVCQRGRIMQRATGHGKMAAIELPATAVAPLLEPYRQQVSIAAVNSPDSTVVSGCGDAVDAVVAAAADVGARTKILQVNYAFHSPQMEPLGGELAGAISGVTVQPAACPVYSTVTGRLARGDDFGSAYWPRNVRQPVLFATAIKEMLAAGVGCFIELGPQPVLGSMIARCSESAEHPPLVLASLRQGVPERRQMLEGLAQLYVAGAEVDWPQVAGRESRCVALPAYPWQQRPFWLETMPSKAGRGRSAPGAAPASWFHDVAWHAKAPLGRMLERAPPSYFPAPDEMALELEPVLASLVARHGLGAADDAVDAIEALAADYVAAALAELGLDPGQGDVIDEAALSRRLGIASRHERLLGRLVEILVEQGVLRRGPDGLFPARSMAGRDLGEQARNLRRRCPAYEVELALLQRCGEQLASVLKGETDPLQLLFPVDSPYNAERLYKDSSSARAYNSVLADAVARVAASLPEGAVLRVLEVGAGTGGTTEFLLQNLPSDRTEYVFTDLSPSLLQSSSEKFRHVRFMRFAQLDIEMPPLGQGFAQDQFDLVIAANVLHATSDLRTVAAHLDELLAPQGMLLVLETTAARRWVDLTFGLLEGWWRFKDTDLRPRHPLLGRDGWLQLLQASGFSARCVGGGAAPESNVFEQQLIIARKDSVQRDRPAMAAAAERRSATWWIFADESGVGRCLADMHEARGGRALLVHRGTEGISGRQDEVRIRPGSPEDLCELSVAAASRGLDEPAAVVFCWGLDLPSGEDQVSVELARDSDMGCGSLLSLAASLSGQDRATRIHIVTRGARVVPGFECPVAVLQAPLQGFGRCMAIEHPEAWGGLIDLDPDAGVAQAASSLLGEIDRDDREDDVAWRRGVRLVPRIVPGGPCDGDEFAVDPAAAYLVTGGLGGLGLKVARWLADAGARHLVLMTRSELPARERWNEVPEGSDLHRRLAGIIELQGLGVQVDVVAGDVADKEFVTQVFDNLIAQRAALKGVIHAAADINFQSIREMEPAVLHQALRAKVLGGWVLHELTREQELDFFVMFSSSTALLGSHGLAHYAAGNSFLDALAHFRHAHGLPALSVNWGTWDEMRVMSEAMRERSRAQGLKPMDGRLALRVLGGLIRAGRKQQLVADIDWSLLRAGAGTSFPLLDAIESGKSAGEPAAESDGQPSLVDELRQLPAEDVRERLAAWVEQQVRHVLRVPAGEAIDHAQGLFQLGLDSLMAVQLRERFQQAFGRVFSATLAFNHSTIDALARHLEETLVDGTVAKSSAAARHTEDLPREAAEDEIEALSDDEARRQLADEINRLFGDDDG